MGPLESFGSIDASALRPALDGASDALAGLHGSFESSLTTVSDAFDGLKPSTYSGIALFTGIDSENLLEVIEPTAMDQIEIMLKGSTNSNGRHTTGLNDCFRWKLNPLNREMSIKQQSGYVAEIISTAKENIKAAAEGTGITTYRTEEKPEYGFGKNDEYVDKIRVNANDGTIEKVQTKFVGKNGADWVKKLTSKEFDKYFEPDRVDKIECPSDYYDDAKAYISQRKADLGKQLERVTADGKADVASGIEARIDKLNKLDDMIEKSLVKTDEAEYARLHPKRFVTKLFASDILDASVKEGASGAALAAGITLVSSSVIHGTEVLHGEISPEEMAREVATEVGTAGALGGATGFITGAVASTMQTSSCNLIRTVGGSCLPAATVSFVVESYDSAIDFAQGAIGADEFAYELGHNAATIAGGTVGGAKVGAVAGTAFGPVGTVAGGLVGGLVGSAVASGAYQTALEYVPDAAQGIAEQAGTYAKEALDTISSEYPQQLDNARAAFNDFFASNGVPVSV